VLLFPHAWAIEEKTEILREYCSGQDSSQGHKTENTQKQRSFNTVTISLIFCRIFGHAVKYSSYTALLLLADTRGQATNNT